AASGGTETIPDVPTGAMHAVSDSAASTNENSLYALGPRMAAHYTRGSACEHMALRAKPPAYTRRAATGRGRPRSGSACRRCSWSACALGASGRGGVEDRQPPAHPLVPPLVPLRVLPADDLPSGEVRSARARAASGEDVDADRGGPEVRRVRVVRLQVVEARARIHEVRVRVADGRAQRHRDARDVVCLRLALLVAQRIRVDEAVAVRGVGGSHVLP